LEQPLVTIVTPSYNQGVFIRATIESVLAQDYPQIEYIVMDGGSTDETARVVAEYTARLTWISEKDRGQAHAINKGFQMARGEFVAWINSDDLLLPGAVSGAVKALQQSPHAAAVYGDGYLMDREGAITQRFPATEGFNLWKLMYLSDYVLQQSIFFRRSAVEAVGWLDESLHYTMDWDLLIRLGKQFGLAYVNQYWGVLREYPEAKSFSGGTRRIREIRRMLERHTGSRRPPGFWLYGLGELQRILKDVLEFRSPRWIRPVATLLSIFQYVTTAAMITMILRHAQGLYIDGWVSDKLRWMVPVGTGEVTFRGMVPDHPRLRGQELEVRTMNGVQLGRWQVGPGRFEIRFSAPPDSRGPLSFVMRATRYKRPALGSEASFRRQAFVLEAVGWGCGNFSNP
jgi:glycosyltransferase involved in cell wall biosynthesis